MGFSISTRIAIYVGGLLPFTTLLGYQVMLPVFAHLVDLEVPSILRHCHVTVE
jgi:hypothetical protein